MKAGARMIQVNKLNAQGKLVFTYPARLVREQDGTRLVEGIFNIESVAVGTLHFRRGDHALRHTIIAPQAQPMASAAQVSA